VRLTALALVLLLAGCAGPAGTDPPEAADDDPQRRSRAAMGGDNEEAAPWGSWRGSTPSRTCVMLLSGCAGITQYGDYATGFRLPGNATAARAVIVWTALQDETEVLEVRAFDSEGELARARGPSPLELVIEDPPDRRVALFVDVALPPAPAVVDHPRQPFEGNYTALWD
jgi:hypothetical protein